MPGEKVKMFSWMLVAAAAINTTASHAPPQ